MGNEKVSQMAPLTAAELAAEDLLLITDISAKESKKITTGDFLTYIETTGSFHTTNSDSASYVLGSNVNGTVKSSSYSLNSDTASFSLRSILSDTASYAKTASITLTCVINATTADTASFLLYSGVPNGTASYALGVGSVDYAKTSSVLLYVPGVSENTSSYAISSSRADSSVSSSFSITSSYSNTSSFSVNSLSSSHALSANTASHLLGYSNSVKAWCSISWSYGANYPEILSSFNIKPQIGDGVENNGGIKYLMVYPSPPYSVALFGVSFQTPLSSNKYSFVGAGSTFMDPILSPTIYGFTMSLDVGVSGWYTTPPASKLWYEPKGFDSFTIFG